MNIWALEGFKVTVTQESARNGYNYDREKIKKYCKIGGIYTVNYTSVGECNTAVFLKEFPKISFNSVNFEDVRSQSKAEDKKHMGYYIFHDRGE
jgi:hypothetical protein